MKSTLQPTKENRPGMPSEKELVVRAQTGDGSAFEELVRRHGPRVYRLARYLCNGQAQDADDTFQNALMKAHRHLAAFRGEAQFSTWLTRIAVNECLLHWRRHRREQDWIRLDEGLGEEQGLPFEPADAFADPEEEYARQEFQTSFQNCLATLPDSFRDAVILQIEGLPINEIATRLGLSPPAVKSRVFRARRRLQECLSKKFCLDQRCYWPGTSMSFGSGIQPKEREKACSLSS